LLLTATFAVIVAILLRLFVIGAFVIPSHSMEWTLLAGDHIVVSKLALSLNDLERGDVIVFRLPDSVLSGMSDELLIKRVIGLPGDTVVLTARSVRINGKRFPNPPLGATTTVLSKGRRTIIVPKGTVFVMGDNRDNSWDSRFWGCLPLDQIVGIPMFVYWSYGSTDSENQPHIRWNRILKMVN
jgi:signal peptidase I